MGSGTDNRKKSDKVYIRRPVKTDALGNVVSSGGAQAAEICMPSFEQRIAETNLTKEGIKVHLQANDDRYEILIGGTFVGKLSKRVSFMVTKCAGLGVRYSGMVIKKQGVIYARFIRL